MFKRIIVKEKWTYIFIVITVLAGIKIIYDGFILLPVDYIQFINNAFEAAIIGAVGFYLFIRMNTHSAWHNPDHPLPKDKDK